MNKLEESLGHPIASSVILKFFRGERNPQAIGVSDCGHLWVATHEGYDTLTWEPYDKESGYCSGQYEIAVRIYTKTEDDMYTMPGYVVENGYMCGRGTGGH